MEPVDSYSTFVEPSRIRVLIVPIGKWRRKKFIDAVDNLRQYNEIRLVDITPIDSSLFTPQGFPQGRLLFKYVTTGVNDSMDLFLYDFEPFRKTFVVIGLVNDDSDPEENLRILKEKYATVISHNLIYNSSAKKSENSHVFHSHNLQERLETIICDVSKNFLMALNHYYSSYKHMTLRSPGAIGGNSVMKTNLTGRSMSKPTGFSGANVASKRLSSIEVTTNSIKRSASVKLSKSLSTAENRVQQRSQGRQLKILGNFQLLAGRYMDALHSFTEAVISLHKIKDYLWLGSALDGVAISFLLLSYLKAPFQIPPMINFLCPVQAPGNTSHTDSPRNSVSFTPVSHPRDSSSSSISVAAVDGETVNLPLLIKTISGKILYYYELSLSDITDYAPQVVYSEVLLKTLTFMVVFNRITELSPEALKLIMDGKLPSINDDDQQLTEPVFPKLEIYYFANKLFELQLKDMSVESQARIYTVLAEVYGALGFMRKKSFVLRLLMVALISDSSKKPLDLEYKRLLADLLRLYGINHNNSPDHELQLESTEQSWMILQKRCLQLCLTVADKVDDKELMAKFAVMLISKYTHLLNRSEQQNLYKKFLNPLIGSGHIDQYWDPFLLRDIKLLRLETDHISAENKGIPIEAELNSVEAMRGKSMPIDTQEVFNPFKKLKPPKDFNQSKINVSQSTFLVKDRGVLSCIVQNPFKFDISINEVHLNFDTEQFCSLGKTEINDSTPLIVSSESLRMVNLSFEMISSTNHKWCSLNSLRVSVIGLPLQEFRIISSDKKLQNGNEINRSYEVQKADIKVLPDQPELQFLRTEQIPDNSFMMLHGTKKSILVTMRNISLSCPIDYLSFTHSTNIEKTIKSDYWKKLPLDDIYTMDKQLDWLKSSCIKVVNAPSHINPNETVSIEFEVDTTSVPFQFNAFDIIITYGMISRDKHCIYLKKMSLPFKVTLKRSIEVPNVELLPLNELPKKSLTSVDWINYIVEINEKEENFKIKDYTLLLLDVRNSWLQGIDVEVEYEEFKSVPHFIEGYHTTRIIVPIKRVQSAQALFKSKPIPKVFEGRQFLSSGLQKDQEIEMREKFWCREHILSRLKCNWKLAGDINIYGLVDFAQFFEKFDLNMVSNMYCDNSLCQISLTIDKDKTNIGEKIEARINVTPVATINIDKNLDLHSSSHDFKRKFQQQSEASFLTMSIMILDTLSSKVLPMSNRRILYNGALTRQISALKPTQASIELLPIEKGQYQLTVCVSNASNKGQMMGQSHFEQVTFVVI